MNSLCHPLLMNNKLSKRNKIRLNKKCVYCFIFTCDFIQSTLFLPITSIYILSGLSICEGFSIFTGNPQFKKIKYSIEIEWRFRLFFRIFPDLFAQNIPRRCFSFTQKIRCMNYPKGSNWDEMDGKTVIPNNECLFLSFLFKRRNKKMPPGNSKALNILKM